MNLNRNHKNYNMASKSPNYTFISRDDSEEDTENLSEELISI